MAPVLKTGKGKLFVGSNPTPSAQARKRAPLTCDYARLRSTITAIAKIHQTAAVKSPRRSESAP